ncbi:hypothetical protein C2S52_005679 [Perilla frutescens var. hirtella]|nr:hypothetical protein C2S52_005679 [Perilla frutescens var. hirtella]
MAYAAVRSLLGVIDGLFDSPISLGSSTRECLQSVYDHATSLATTLECCSEGVGALEKEVIIEEARRLEDSIEFPLSTHILLLQSQIGEPTFSLNPDQLRRDADCFAQIARKMKENIEELWEQKVSETIEEHVKESFVPKTEEEVSSATNECDMVGLFDQFRCIRDRLIASERVPSYDTVICISGMAGIGKTTLARKLLQDPSVKAHFECVAFVRVGPEFRREEVLDAIIAQLNLQDQKMIMEGNFVQRFCTILTLRKSLIVLDDVWNYFGFLFSISLFSKETHIVVTSRVYSNFPGVFNLKMRFMDEEESWELLRRNVFGEEECPPQLLKPGKKIAKHCEGLPLLIIAVAPILLSEAQKDPECWKRVAEKPHSVLEKASHQISEVLLSSYHPLTEYQKLCFLYLAAFPLKYIVRRSTIINLWHVERFHRTQSIDYYSDTYEKLFRNNLFMGHEENLFSGIPKACSLHCAYWYLSKRVAEDNKFLYTINGYADALDECVKSHRRLAIYENVLFAIKEWKVLRVLNAVTIRFYEFPAEVLKLILLRYLALTCNADLPASISKLWNLKFLIVNQHSGIKRVRVESYVPAEVWDLQKLEHLEIMGRNLHDPPHPEKLRIQIEFAPNATETISCFDHISYLRSLKSFHCLIINPTLLRPPPPLAILPSRLEKLTLSGFGYPWEHMRKILELPYLRELKLQHYAFRGEKWDAEVIKHSDLRSLTIEDTDLVEWTLKVSKNCSFSPEFLTFKNCYKLREIPRFPYVRAIKLVDCNPLIETCAKQKHPGVDTVLEDPVKPVRDAFADALGALLALGMNPDAQLPFHIVGVYFSSSSSDECKLAVSGPRLKDAVCLKYLHPDSELQNYALLVMDMLRSDTSVDAQALVSAV